MREVFHSSTAKILADFSSSWGEIRTSETCTHAVPSLEWSLYFYFLLAKSFYFRISEPLIICDEEVFLELYEVFKATFRYFFKLII